MSIISYLKSYLFILILLLLFPSLLAAKESSVGNIKTLKGDVVVIRNKKPMAATVGMPVFQGDLIQTAAAGSVGVIFQDDTIISLGPDSKLDISEYVYEPKDEKFSMFMKMLKGTFVYISGAIGRLSPDSVKLETPSSMIGTRGTKILVEVKA